MRNLRRVWPVAILLLVSAFWGFHAVVGKAALAELSPLPLTVWRFTFGALLYAPFARRFIHIFRLPAKQFWQLAFSGLCLSVVYPLFYYQSLRHLSPVESLLLVNTAPLLAAVVSWAALREHLSRWEWLGIVVSFLGIAVLVIGQPAGQASTLGIVLALVGAAAFATYTVASRSLFQTLPLFDVLLATSVWGAVQLWIIAGLSGQWGLVAGALTHLTRAGWAEFLYIVLIVSTVSYVLYGIGLRRLPAGVASALTIYPQVVFAALFQWFWLGLAPTLLTGASALLILGGTAITRIKRSRLRPERT